MTHKPKTEAPTQDEKPAKKSLCGIVMPISGMSEVYSADHWKRVCMILETAIRQAGFTPNVVWNNDQLDIIQSKILQNIYDNDIIICDLSNLNPNVMFEAGLRLSTKKPTVLVADSITKVPFDLSPFQYIPYQSDLEYNAINDFIASLSEKLKDIHRLHSENKYKSYVENFNFEVATPGTIDVPSSQLILDRLANIEEIISSVLTKSHINIEEYKSVLSNTASNMSHLLSKDMSRQNRNAENRRADRAIKIRINEQDKSIDKKTISLMHNLRDFSPVLSTGGRYEDVPFKVLHLKEVSQSEYKSACERAKSIGLDILD